MSVSGRHCGGSALRQAVGLLQAVGLVEAKEGQLYSSSVVAFKIQFRSWKRARSCRSRIMRHVSAVLIVGAASLGGCAQPAPSNNLSPSFDAMCTSRHVLLASMDATSLAETTPPLLCALECLAAGRCTSANDACTATENCDCQRSALCELKGKCTVSDSGTCMAGSELDCARSADCLSHGLCAPLSGSCIATKAAHCQNSTYCGLKGMCILKGQRCCNAEGTCWP